MRNFIIGLIFGLLAGLLYAAHNGMQHEIKYRDLRIHYDKCSSMLFEAVNREAAHD